MALPCAWGSLLGSPSHLLPVHLLPRPCTPHLPRASTTLMPPNTHPHAGQISAAAKLFGQDMNGGGRRTGRWALGGDTFAWISHTHLRLCCLHPKHPVLGPFTHSMAPATRPHCATDFETCHKTAICGHKVDIHGHHFCLLVLHYCTSRPGATSLFFEFCRGTPSSMLPHIPHAPPQFAGRAYPVNQRRRCRFPRFSTSLCCNHAAAPAACAHLRLQFQLPPPPHTRAACLRLHPTWLHSALHTFSCYDWAVQLHGCHCYFVP